MVFERKEISNMKKEIKPYKQTGPTCAIVCMMMVLQYNGLLDKCSNKEETRLYEMYESKAMGGTPFSALAFHLGKSGLKTELYHSEKNYFSNEKKSISEYIFNYALEEYKEYISKAKEFGLKVYNEINIDTDLLKEKLDEGKLLIIAGKKESFLHAILICEYDDKGFFLYDPLETQKLYKSYKDIEEFMKTEIGKWFLCVNTL